MGFWKEMKKSRRKCRCTGPNSLAALTFFFIFISEQLRASTSLIYLHPFLLLPSFGLQCKSRVSPHFPPESTIVHFHGQVPPWKINHPVAAALIGHCRAITGRLITYPPPTSFPFHTSPDWSKRRLKETHHFLPTADLTSIASRFKVSLHLPLCVLWYALRAYSLHLQVLFVARRRLLQFESHFQDNK